MSKASFKGTPYREIDSGFDFYAAQTLKAADGRTIMIAWMQMWKRSMPTSELGHLWAGSMTLPRELTLDGDALIQAPVREIEAYRLNRVAYENIALHGELALEGVAGDRIELIVRADVRRANSFGLRVFSGERHRTTIAWDASSGRVVMDRGGSGIPIRELSLVSGTRMDNDMRAVRIDTSDGMIELRIFLDRSSVEVFLQGGRATITGTVYPNKADTGVVFFCEGEATLISVEKHDIRL